MSGGLNEQKGTNSVDSGVGEKAAGVCNARARGSAAFAPTASIVNLISVTCTFFQVYLQSVFFNVFFEKARGNATFTATASIVI